MKTISATEAKNRLGALLDDRSGNIRTFLKLRDEVAAAAAAKGLTDARLEALLAGHDR